MVLSMQEQLASVNAKLDKLTEQIAIANNYRFGRHTEKLICNGHCQGET